MKMTENEKQALRDAFRIVKEFRDMLEKEIQEKRNMLLMSSGYENLDTVLGLLGSLDEELGCGLAVQAPGTRQALRTAYAHLEAVMPNTVDGSLAQQACCQMEAALFSVLNMAYRDGNAQEALEKALAAARFGLEIAESLAETGPGSLGDGYLSQSGQELDAARLEVLAATFRSLLPEAEAGAENDEDEDGGESHEKEN